MKTLTDFVALILALAASGIMASGMPAAAQTSALAADLEVDTLMSMPSVGMRAAMQAYNGGACHVTPISDLPIAVRSVFGQPVSSIFVGQTPAASHFIASDVDKTYFSNRTVVVSLCSHLKPGQELEAMRKSAEKHGLPNASHLAWIWETLSFDRGTHEETVVSRFYLDDHGLPMKALGEIFPGLPALMVLRPTSPSYYHDIENFLESHQPARPSEIAHLNSSK